MSALRIHLKARPRLYAAATCGLLCGAVIPTTPGWTYRVLIGWNVAVWIYLALVALVMARADHGRLRRVAATQAQTGPVVLVVVVAAAVASLCAIVFELAAVKAHGGAAWPHLLLAAGTVVGSWLLLPVIFALDYAGRYYRGDGSRPAGGLTFPDTDAKFEPDYADFLYFSFTIAVASQTADVAVASRPMRRLVLAHALLSFAFNAAILALTINIAAGLF